MQCSAVAKYVLVSWDASVTCGQHSSLRGGGATANGWVGSRYSGVEYRVVLCRVTGEHQRKVVLGWEEGSMGERGIV